MLKGKNRTQPYPKACSQLLWVCVSFCSVFLGLSTAQGQAVPVRVDTGTYGYQLMRDGKPYYVKGAGGQVELDQLVALGGNSIRTWSTDNAEFFLDEAHKRGLTVMMGLWLGHERHGFDYNDSIAVRKQYEFFKTMVLKLKDHPALLMWGIGNEVDLFYKNTRVWDAVQDIAKMIHEVDPNHPTSTVTAGLDSLEVALVLAKCPDIDIYCVNTYGDLEGALKNIRPFGWRGPYMITEWGPNGHWEVAKTSWNAPIEQNSSEKAKTYNERYTYILQDSQHCLGSYLFLWGQKQETTPTWYGVFDEKGRATEALDNMKRHWSGTAPENSCPRVVALGLMVDGQLQNHGKVAAGAINTAVANFQDAENDKLKWVWRIVPESDFTKAGGDAEIAPEALTARIQKSGNTATFTSPKTPGAYRLFVYCYDNNGHVAYGNIPFYVEAGEAATKTIQIKQRTLVHDYE